MEQALAVRDVTRGMDMNTLGNVLAKSGFFQDTKDAAQAIVKVMAGAELGIGPIAAMQGVYIVKGKVTFSANIIGAAIKRSGRYDYRVASMTNEGCTIHFFERGQQIGESSFTVDDAKAANLLANPTYRQFPRNMLFARALTNGARWYCPDVMNGSPLYTPDELGAQTDEDGRVISGGVDLSTGEVIDAEPAEPKPAPALSKVEAALPEPAEPEPAGSRTFEERTQLMQEWNALRTRGMKAGLQIKEIDTANLPLEKLAEWTGLLEDKVIRAESVVGTEVPA